MQVELRKDLNWIDDTYPLTIKSSGLKSSDSQTRPNDTAPYIAGDVVGQSPADNLVFSNVVSATGVMICILGVFLRVDVGAVPSGMTTFRLHLFDTAPTAIADNSPWVLADADREKYLGFITLNAPEDFGGTLWSQTPDANFFCQLASGSNTLYGQLMTVPGYTPTALVVNTVGLNSVVA